MAWNDPDIGIEWPELKGGYKGSPAAEGYTMADGTPLTLSDKDQKWLGLKETFSFEMLRLGDGRHQRFDIRHQMAETRGQKSDI